MNKIISYICLSFFCVVLIGCGTTAQKNNSLYYYVTGVTSFDDLRKYEKYCSESPDFLNSSQQCDFTKFSACMRARGIKKREYEMPNSIKVAHSLPCGSLSNTY